MFHTSDMEIFNITRGQLEAFKGLVLSKQGQQRKTIYRTDKGCYMNDGISEATGGAVDFCKVICNKNDTVARAVICLNWTKLLKLPPALPASSNLHMNVIIREFSNLMIMLFGEDIPLYKWVFNRQDFNFTVQLPDGNSRVEEYVKFLRKGFLPKGFKHGRGQDGNSLENDTYGKGSLYLYRGKDWKQRVEVINFYDKFNQRMNVRADRIAKGENAETEEEIRAAPILETYGLKYSYSTHTGLCAVIQCMKCG